jgi:hypothetical protein
LFAELFKFRLIEELTYEIDVRFQEILTNDALRLNVSLSYCFKLHFHIYYLFVVFTIDVKSLEEQTSS